MNPRPQGFSLLEVLVALTVMAMMMVFVYKMVSDSVDAKDRILAEDRQLLSVEFALFRIESDWAQLYTPLFYSAVDLLEKDSGQDAFEPTETFPNVTKKGNPVPLMRAEDSSSVVIFTSANRRKVQDSKQSRYAWIRYSLKGEQLHRQVISENIYLGEHDWDRVRPQVLLKGVKKLEWTYWDEESQRFESGHMEKELAIPRLVKVFLVWTDLDGVEQELTRTYRVLWPFWDTQNAEGQGQDQDTQGPQGLQDPQGQDTQGPQEPGESP